MFKYSEPGTRIRKEYVNGVWRAVTGYRFENDYTNEEKKKRMYEKMVNLHVYTEEDEKKLEMLLEELK